MTDYVYNISEGNVEYSPFSLFQNHTLTMTGSYLESNFSFSRQGNDLVIYTGLGSTITINGHFNLLGFSQIDTVFVQNGSTYDLTDPNTKILNNDNNTPFGDVGNTDDETILGGVNDNTISGYGGDDTIYLGDGDDTGDGGDGNDILYGGFGDDTINGGNGNDFIDAGTGNNVIDGGAGIDTISYENAESRIVIKLENDFAFDNGQGGTDDVFNIENVIGSQFDDLIEGNELENIIYSGDGNDRIFLENTRDGIPVVIQGGEHDILYAGAGNDIVSLNTENTYYLDGGEGRDTIRFSTITDDFVTVDTQAGTIHVNNETTARTNFVDMETVVTTTNDDFIYGSSVDEVFQGNQGSDWIEGKGGKDNILGQSGDDILFGGDGNDTINGGSENDILYGGDGLDILTGSAGEDTFVFESASAFNDIDRITDFDSSENDAIDLSDILQAYDPLNDAISDFVQVTSDTTHSYLEVDSDGGADNFVRIAQFDNDITIDDAATLELNGNIIS